MDLIDGSGLWLGSSPVLAPDVAIANGGIIQGQSYEQALEFWERYGRPQGETDLQWQYPVPAKVDASEISVDEIELDDEEVLLML